MSMSNDVTRAFWETLGKVVEVFEGKDKRVRNVAIKLGLGVVRRPVTKVAVILESE